MKLMNRQKSLKNAAYQNNRRKTGPLIPGTRVLQVLCGILLILNLWLLYSFFSSSKGILHYRQHRQQVQELERKTQSLMAANKKLFEQVEDFKKDAAFQERVVRRQLGWVRQGELVIEFLPPKQ